MLMPRIPATSIPMLTAALLAGGCAGDGRAPASRMLSPEDFASASRSIRHESADLSRRLDAQGVAQASGMPTVTDPGTSAIEPGMRAGDVRSTPVRQRRPSEPVLSISAEVGSPPPEVLHNEPADSPSEADAEGSLGALWPAKVGEVSGRPIYTDRVLADLMDRLRAEAKQPRMTRDAWQKSARDQIKLAIERAQVQDLLAAEGRANLQEGQKQGLRSFIAERAAEQDRRYRGSQELRARALANEGLSEQQWLRREESEVLARQQMNETLDRRVRVTWPEIRIAYERDREKFNPPPKAKVRLISVDADDAGAVAEIQRALEAGSSFADVALDERNTSFRAEGGLMQGEQVLDGETFEDERLNAAIGKLKEREWTREPVVIGFQIEGKPRREAVWIYIEALESKARPLTDPLVQMEITRDLTQRKRLEELDRYILQLRGRAGVQSVRELDAIVDRLVRVVTEEVWPDASASPTK